MGVVHHTSPPPPTACRVHPRHPTVALASGIGVFGVADSEYEVAEASKIFPVLLFE